MIAALTRASGHFGVNPKEAERFFKFMVVGAIGFGVDFGLFNLLIEPFNQLLAVGEPLYDLLVNLGIDPDLVVTLGPTFAGTISFIAAIISNFLWNRYWTYPDSRAKSPRRQFVMFFLVSLAGILMRIPIIMGWDKLRSHCHHRRHNHHHTQHPIGGDHETLSTTQCSLRCRDPYRLRRRRNGADSDHGQHHSEHDR